MNSQFDYMKSCAGVSYSTAVSSEPMYPKTLLALTLYLLVSAGRVYALFPKFSLVAIPWGEISGILLITVFILEFTAKGRGNYSFSYADWCVLGLVILGAMGIPFSVWEGGSFKSWINFLKVALLFFGTSFAVRQFADLLRLFRVLAFCIILTVMAAFNAGISHSTLYLGMMYDPNDVALIMVIGMPVLFYLSFLASGIKKLFYLVLSILCSVVIILSGSRGALLGLISFPLYGIFTWPRARVKIIGIGFLGVVLYFTMAPAASLERFSTIWSPQTEYDRSYGNRTEIWKRGLTTIATKPIFGAGMGNFAVADGSLKGEGAWQTAHNSLIQLGGEMGIPALLTFMYLVSGTFWKLRQKRQTTYLQEIDTVQVGALRALEFSLVSFMVCGLFLSQAYLSYLYFILGLSQAALRIDTKEEMECL